MGRSVVVIGAGLGGLRVVEHLRRGGFDGAVTLVGLETHPPYDRPPLSKEVLRGEKSAEDIRLRAADFFADNEVTLRLGVAATSLDTAAREVGLSDGSTLPYEDLVVATGIVPRRLRGTEGLAGVHVLRTLEDALALRADAGDARSALVIGAGFIGCEAAVALRAAGLPTVLVEPQPAPLAGAVGSEVGGLVARLHTEAGVDVRCGVGVSELRGDRPGRRGVLSDGSEVDADLVVSGIGSTPAIDWVRGSGLELGNGILCDERGRTSDPHVWAVGDVAAWRRPADGRHIRVEHWTNTVEQSAIVAGAILGKDDPLPPSVPYFWSDQYNLRIQALGHVSPEDDVRVLEDDGRKFLAVFSRDGLLTAAVGCGLPARVMKFRRPLLDGARIDELDLG